MCWIMVLEIDIRYAATEIQFDLQHRDLVSSLAQNTSYWKDDDIMIIITLVLICDVPLF